jgi:hypothetical protein
MYSSGQRFDQLLFAALQPFVPQQRQTLCIRLPLGQGMENTKATRSKQIGDHNRQLDAHLFQQALDLTIKPYSVAYQLQLHPGQVAPDTLLSTGHKTQDELLSNEPPHQPLRVLEIMLPPSASAVGKRLRQVQTHVRLQLHPHRSPVLRRRFHDRFFDPLLLQPVR